MRRRRTDTAFYAFDLLWRNGEDLRVKTTGSYKRRLQRLLKDQDRILFAEHVLAKGTALFQAICEKDLEGIVAKHRLAPYSTKPESWFKILNPA